MLVVEGYETILSKNDYNSEKEIHFECRNSNQPMSDVEEYEMEDILRPIYQERTSHPNTLGALLIEQSKKSSPLTDTFDIVLFLIVKEAEEPVFIKHYSYKEQKAALHIVTEAKLNEWILLGSNRKVIDWLFNGKVLFDRNEFIQNLKTELRDFPFYGRKIKMGMEFAKLIRRYMDGKEFFESKHYLDAYNHIVHSLASFSETCGYRKWIPS